MNNPICQLILSHKKQKIKNQKNQKPKKSTHKIPTPQKTTLTLPPNNSVRFTTHKKISEIREICVSPKTTHKARSV